MEDEINIMEIVKSRRYFKNALRILLPREQRLSMREKSNYICIDPSDDETRAEDDFDDLMIQKPSHHQEASQQVHDIIKDPSIDKSIISDDSSKLFQTRHKKLENSQILLEMKEQSFSTKRRNDV